MTKSSLEETILAPFQIHHCELVSMPEMVGLKSLVVADT